MTTQGPRSHTYEINAMLRVSKESEDRIRAFFSESYGVRPTRLQSELHLTVYHGRRPLPGLQEEIRSVHIAINTAETRFMVLAPGGENPREEIDPRAHSVGIRLTKRNVAIPTIQKLRELIYRLETRAAIGNRKPSSAWTNCFGSRNYQPHVQLLRPWHKVDATLTELGLLFRNQIDRIEFDLFQVEERHRLDGQWVPGSPIELRRGSTPVISGEETVRLRKLFHDPPHRSRR